MPSRNCTPRIHAREWASVKRGGKASQGRAAISMMAVHDHRQTLNRAERAMAAGPELSERAARCDEEVCHMIGR